MILTPVFDSPFSSVFTQSTLDSMVRALFVNGAQGGMWDPSDLSTLFQDSAGTTPVTAVEQTVGRMLDKSGNGNHFVQATASKRPVYSRRYNAWVGTENPATFIKLNVSLTAAPAGPLHFELADDTSTGTHQASIPFSGFGEGKTFTASFLAKPLDSTRYFYLNVAGGAPNVVFDLLAGVVVSQGGAADLFSSVSRDAVTGICACKIRFTQTLAFTSSAWRFGLTTTGVNEQTYMGDGTQRVALGSISIIEGAFDIPYQRVTTATDYDDDPRKFPAYLKFDGVDDIYDTVSTVPFSSQQMLACLGFTKLSDVTTAVSFELNDYYSKAPGGFGLLTPDNAMTSALACGCAGSSTTSSAGATGYPAPLSSVLTGLFDTGGSIPVTLRHNGAIIGTNPAAVGAVNFGNFALHMGARVGPTYPLLGRIYCAVALEGNITPEAVNTIERWSAQRLRISL